MKDVQHSSLFQRGCANLKEFISLGAEVID
jgi:hypothetical protein